MRKLFAWLSREFRVSPAAREANSSASPVAHGALESADPPAQLPEADWSEEHRAHWAQFLSTPTGQAFLARWRVLEGLVATQSCKDVFHTAHSAGTANGWNQSRVWAESLSRAARAHAETGPAVKPDDSQKQGRSSLAELLSP
jgi:hypothetical protein